MKKVTVLALLGAGLAVQAANADVASFFYTGTMPAAKSSFTITLSGECSGKITKTVTDVDYERVYTHIAGVIERDGADVDFDVRTDDNEISVHGDNNFWTSQDKATETVKNGELSLKTTYASAATVLANIRGLDNGAYDDLISCKNGQTLGENLVTFDPSINDEANPFSVKATLTHTHNVADPSVGEYTIKFTSQGVLEQKSDCPVDGDLVGDGDYSVTCAQPKTIKVKISVDVSGESVPDV